MRTYSLAYEYSRTGTGWTRATATVKATSDMGAIAQVQSKYPYVRNIKILSVR